jgi:hypothetical protein
MMLGTENDKQKRRENGNKYNKNITNVNGNRDGRCQPAMTRLGTVSANPQANRNPVKVRTPVRQ